jgi:hypothetical protein
VQISAINWELSYILQHADLLWIISGVWVFSFAQCVSRVTFRDGHVLLSTCLSTYLNFIPDGWI